MPVASVPNYNPYSTVYRDVLVYPADGSPPHILSMEFSVEGARSTFLHSSSTYPNLSSCYGKSLQGLRTHLIGSPPDIALSSINSDPDELYSIIFNIDPKLPLNLTWANTIGLDPKRPGTLPTFRGDAFIIKEASWRGRVEDIHSRAAPLARIWLDVSIELLEDFNKYLKEYYLSDSWKGLIAVEERSLKVTLLCGGPLYPTNVGDEPGKISKHTYHKLLARGYQAARRAKQKVDQQTTKELKYATQSHCSVCHRSASPSPSTSASTSPSSSSTITTIATITTSQLASPSPTSVDAEVPARTSTVSTTTIRACSRCKSVYYCSKVCQRADWAVHKKDCSRRT